MEETKTFSGMHYMVRTLMQLTGGLAGTEERRQPFRTKAGDVSEVAVIS